MKKFIKVFSAALVLLLVAGLLPGLSLPAYAAISYWNYVECFGEPALSCIGDGSGTSFTITLSGTYTNSWSGNGSSDLAWDGMGIGVDQDSTSGEII